MLTSFEQQCLEHFKLQDRPAQEEMLRLSINDPACSGPLIQAYQRVMEAQ